MKQVITQTAPEAWDAFVAAQPGAHVLQTSAWAHLKRAYGWQSGWAGLMDNDRVLSGAQILFRPLPYHLGTMAYLAMGPYIPDAALSSPTWQTVHTAARQHHAAFLKWEPGFTLANPFQLGFRPSPQTVQPPRTILIDIMGTDDQIMARMNQGTRRKIRQSLKNDISYAEATRAEVDDFMAMMNTTGERNNFGVHEPGYYALAYDLYVPSGSAALILARHEGDVLAGVFVFAVGRNAWYLYGASSDVKRNLMATYGAQWQAVQWAKAHGCTTYDLYGIPDAEPAELEAQFEQRSDGLWGVYGFKRGWGGEIVRTSGAWDYTYNPLIYTAYRFALRRTT